MEPPLSRADSALGEAWEASLADPAASSGKLKKSKKKTLEAKKWQSLEETGSNGPRTGKRPSLCRSKTYDLSFSKDADQEPAPGRQRAPSSTLTKHVASYHKAFKAIPEEETLLDSISCAWQRDVPYHGRLYVSPNFLCFHCNVLLRDVKVVIPVPSIASFKKANTALLVPNALSIRTAEGEKFLFVSLRTREATYQLLRSVCKHLQDGSTSSKSPASPANTGSEQPRDKALADRTWLLAGGSNPRANGYQTSSQSDLEQNPHESDGLLDQADGLSPEQSREEEDKGEQTATVSKGGAQSGRPAKKKPRGWWSHLSTLNVVILIYLLLALVLLLSSGYIGLRIVALEQQLTSMGAWPELNLQRHYKTT